MAVVVEVVEERDGGGSRGGGDAVFVKSGN